MTDNPLDEIPAVSCFCWLTQGVKSKPPLKRKSTEEWGNRQMQDGAGTELTIGGVNVHMDVDWTRSWWRASGFCNSHHILLLCLKQSSHWRQKSSSRGVPEDPLVYVCNSSRRKEDSSYMKRKKWAKKAKDKKALWFSSQAVLCQLHIMFLDKSYNAPERLWNTFKLSRKVSKISQEKVTTQKTITCEL